jgi:hypothetical protein
MIGKIARGFAMLLLAAVLGIGSAWALLRMPVGSTIRSGAWSTNLDVGSDAADIYTRARVAVSGLFALNQSETIYFTAVEDDQGRPLSASCTYVIDGTALPARWWSITAYGADHYLIPNVAGRYSFNMRNAGSAADGRFSFLASGKEQPGRWLPSNDASGHFDLTLRLYNPTPDALAHLDRLQLPRIQRQGDCP